MDGDVRKEVVDALLRSGYLQEEDARDEAGDGAILDALSAYIRTENFEEREQRRGFLDRAVLEYMKGSG